MTCSHVSTFLSHDHSTNRMMEEIVEDAMDGFTDELECKICFSLYTLGNRRPKLLECFHCFCAKCLKKMIDFSEGSLHVIVCPFCRYPTSLPGGTTECLPDDSNIIAILRIQRSRKHLHDGVSLGEVLFSPHYLSSLDGPSNITTETPQEARNTHPSHHNSLPDSLSSIDSTAIISWLWPFRFFTSLFCLTVAKVMVWLCGLLYFCSLPLGVYLLIAQRTTLGVILVSLVPSSLLAVIIYGFCQCVCQKICDCISC